MIIVQLKGGLGNQMFQYAAGLSLATHHGVQVKVDVNQLRKPDEEIGTFRAFDLQHITEPPIIATRAEIDQILHQHPVKIFFQKLLPPHRRNVYRESSLRFDPAFRKAGSRLYLKGYRQSEQYFKRIESVVRQQFQMKPERISHLTHFASELIQQPSVAVHIRRGDYTNKKVEAYHGTPGQDYYRAAIPRIEQQISNPKYFIFSDDIEWVRNNLQFNGEVSYVTGSITENQCEDFYLMSQCRHNIIANSTFSWWAAWLNDNPQKIVIAPKKWYNKPGLDTSDLIPAGWIRI